MNRIHLKIVGIFAVEWNYVFFFFQFCLDNIVLSRHTTKNVVVSQRLSFPGILSERENVEKTVPLKGGALLFRNRADRAMVLKDNID